MLSDAEIMKRVQAGETGLFAELVFRHRPGLSRFACSKSQNAQAAEDLVQEAFLAAFQARDSYSPEFAFSTWMWTILINLCRRAHRQNIRQSQLISHYFHEHPTASSSAADGLEGILQQEQQAQLHEWLGQIPEEEADALRLRYFGGLKYEEVALAMDSSLSGAKVRVKRGLQRLANLAHNRRCPPWNPVNGVRHRYG